MASLMSATVQVKDPEKLKVYVSQVGATMAPHGGKMVARGKVAKQISGEVKHQIEALFEFPSADAIDAWYGRCLPGAHPKPRRGRLRDRRGARDLLEKRAQPVVDPSV